MAEEEHLPSAPGKAKSLWRSADYVGWWSGNTISALGTSVAAISYPLLLLHDTGSVAQASFAGSLNLLGVLVTTLWGGALADRVSRKAILVAGPLAQSLVLAVITVMVHAERAHVALVVGASLLSGLMTGVTLGASTPALRRIVPKEQLPSANGQAMGRDMAAQLLGAPLGGMLFSVARWLPFAADAVSYLFASLGALLIRRPLGPDRGTEERQGSTMVQEVAAGLRFVRHQPFLRDVVLLAAVLNMVAAAFALLLVALVKYRGGDPTEIGVVTAMTMVGGVAGAILAPVLAARIRPRSLVHIAMWVFTVAFAATAIVPELWQIAVVVCLAHLSVVPINVVLQSYVIQLVPDAFTGRVAAVNRFGAYALEWVGPLLAGMLAALLGVAGAVAALVVVMFPVALALHFSRGLDVLGAPLDRVDELSGEPVTK
ncbi:MFS transporter [Streptomyces sp. NPDC059651]|uniref:MFS transporter n=1 Tax=Streptomyces sp. NPDC059651 TaxID=3346897 RepID=UPI0036A442FB